MLLLLEINFLHLILPVALLLAGWPPPLPRTHPFHRGEGGWCYDHDHGRGGGGGPGTWNIYIEIPWNTLFIQCLLKHPQRFRRMSCPSTKAQIPLPIPFPNWHLYSKFQHCLGICPSCMCDTSNSSCMMLPSRKNTCQKNWGKKSSVSSYGGTVKRQVL